MEGSGMRSKSKLLAGIATTASVTAVALAMSTSAFAQKNINLTAIDGYPPKASWVREFIKYYIPAINKRLAATGNYKISWNQAWSGQIVKTKHVLEGLQKGLGDIGVVTTVFHGDKVPVAASRLLIAAHDVVAQPIVDRRGQGADRTQR